MNLQASPTSQQRLADETRNRGWQRERADSAFGSVSEPVAVQKTHSLGSAKGLISDSPAISQ